MDGLAQYMGTGQKSMVTALEHQSGVALKDSEEGKLSQLAELGMGYLVSGR